MILPSLYDSHLMSLVRFIPLFLSFFQKCSPQDGPTIDATDILEGDYVNDDCSIQSYDVPPPPPEEEQGSFVEMTDSEQEKPIRSVAYQLAHTRSLEPGAEYVPNSFGTASPPAEADNVIDETERTKRLEVV
jgi:hypothetical protein